jgi:hypothetical protein
MIGVLAGVAALLVVSPLLEITGWRLDAGWSLLAAFLAVQPGNRAVVGAAFGGLLLDVLAGGALGPRLFGLMMALTAWTMLAPGAERRAKVAATGARVRHWTDRPTGWLVLATLSGGVWWCSQFAATGVERGWCRDVLWNGGGVLTDVAKAWTQTGRDGIPPAIATGLAAAMGAVVFSRAGGGSAGRVGRQYA